MVCRNTSGEPSPSSECGGAKPPEVKACHGHCEYTGDTGGEAGGGWERLDVFLNDTFKIGDNIEEDESYDYGLEDADMKEEWMEENEDQEERNNKVPSNPK